MTHVDLKDAEEQFMKLIERAASGEEIVIDKDKRPFVKLSAANSAASSRTFGSAKGLIQLADDFDEPLEDIEEYT